MAENSIEAIIQSQRYHNNRHDLVYRLSTEDNVNLIKPKKEPSKLDLNVEST